MARIEIDPNYSSPTFSRATVGTDLFKKEDVQQLAAAVSTHDHTTGKGAVLVAGSIPAGSITSGMIADGTIVAGDIADGAVTSAKILDGTIATADHADASVTNAKLASDTARANLLTNGGFEIWQRGTGAFTVSGFTADRWQAAIAAPSSASISAVTGVARSNRAMLATYTHSGGGSLTIYQDLESTHLQGRTVRWSLYILTPQGGAMSVISNNGSADTVLQTTVIPANAATFVRWDAGGVVPADSVRLRCQVGPNSVSGTFYMDDAMLVVGSVAADYAPLHPADDLTRCLRYYEIRTTTGGGPLVSGFVFSTTQMTWLWEYQAVKATTPTITSPAAINSALLSAAGAALGTTSVTSGTGITPYHANGYASVASGLVAGNATQLAGNTGIAIGIIAEANP